MIVCIAIENVTQSRQQLRQQDLRTKTHIYASTPNLPGPAIGASFGEPNISVEKQLAGKGQLKDLRANCVTPSGAASTCQASEPNPVATSRLDKLRS
jgi:hypothetical protein